MRNVNIFFGPRIRRGPRLVLVWVGTFVGLVVLLWWLNSRGAAMEGRPVEMGEEAEYIRGD